MRSVPHSVSGIVTRKLEFRQPTDPGFTLVSARKVRIISPEQIRQNEGEAQPVQHKRISRRDVALCFGSARVLPRECGRQTRARILQDGHTTEEQASEQ